MTGAQDIPVRVAAAEMVAEGIRRFRLEPVGREPLPLFSPGAHVVVSMPAEGRTIRNPYSLMGAPDDPSGYEITVLRTKDSRGGSIYMHEAVRPGSTLTISQPVNLFPIDRRARKHLLIAGGIGITPFLPMARTLAQEGGAFELHYAMRNDQCAAYRDELRARYGARVKSYCSADGERLPIDGVLARQPLGTHLYVCGPERMIDDVLARARAAGWPEQALHAERFLAPPVGAPFEIKVSGARTPVKVGPTETMLEALERAGFEPPYLCRGGACGQCETRVLSADGEIEHHDHFLTADERAGGEKIMLCVSRLKSGSITIDLGASA